MQRNVLPSSGFPISSPWSGGGRISGRIFRRFSRPCVSLCAACRVPSPTPAHPHLLRLRSMV